MKGGVRTVGLTGRGADGMDDQGQENPVAAGVLQGSILPPPPPADSASLTPPRADNLVWCQAVNKSSQVRAAGGGGGWSGR